MATVRRLPSAPLTPAQRALASSPAALAMLARVAARMAARYGRVVSHDDLYGAGTVGLTEAARTFVASMGVAFEVYAWSRVHGAMVSAVRREVAHAERARQGGYRAVERTRDEGDVWNDGDAEQRAQMEAFSDAFVAGMFLGLTGEATRAWSSGPERGVGGHEAYARALEALRRAVEALPEPDPRLLELIYREEQSLEASGAALGMPYSTARRAHLKALERLATRLRAAGVQGPPSRPAGGA
jgi:RNA polymerase sigma factor for flagellar operon FliA